MCMICDGYSIDDVHGVIESTIATYGWHVQGVVPGEDEDRSSFAYTIGLAESFGLPELVITGIDWEIGAAILNEVAHQMTDGDELAIVAATLGLRHGVVHQRYIDEGDWFGGWQNYYETTPAQGTFVQVFAPPQAYCPCHRHVAPDLTVGAGAPAGNRAARRRARRRGPRR